MINSLNERLRKSFSASADQYDILASLHREIARDLMAKLPKPPEGVRLLDVGCGTGYLTNKLKSHFPDATVVGLDFAPGMIKKAQEKYEGDSIQWQLGDALSMPFENNSFNGLASNLAYQWMPLSKAFGEAARVLKDDGFFAATLFGFYTCDELFNSLSAVGVTVKERLPSQEDVGKALAAQGFKDIKLDYERIHVQFENIWEVLTWLKSIGANQLTKQGFLGVDALKKAQEHWRKHYPYHHGVRVTFEIIWAICQK